MIIASAFPRSTTSLRSVLLRPSQSNSLLSPKVKPSRRGLDPRRYVVPTYRRPRLVIEKVKFLPNFGGGRRHRQFERLVVVSNSEGAMQRHVSIVDTIARRRPVAQQKRRRISDVRVAMGEAEPLYAGFVPLLVFRSVNVYHDATLQPDSP